jgi:hypothetical protein
VPQIDLELSAGELMISGDNIEPVRRELPERTKQHVLRITLQTRNVDIAGCLAVTLPAGRVLPGAFQHIELKLGANDWLHTKISELLNHPLEHHPRAFLRWRAVRIVDVGNNVRDARFPWHDLSRADVWEGQHIREPSFETALDVNNVAHWCGRVDGPAEGDPVADRTCKAIDQDVASPIGTDQIRIPDAYDVNALRHHLGGEVL